uniref:Uncharacterized protein n=1 Tax=Leersia perrieri TaxID=77586 RepID=A0A0D9XYQ5_9ORYZ
MPLLLATNPLPRRRLLAADPRPRLRLLASIAVLDAPKSAITSSASPPTMRIRQAHPVLP